MSMAGKIMGQGWLSGNLRFGDGAEGFLVRDWAAGALKGSQPLLGLRGVAHD